MSSWKWLGRAPSSRIMPSLSVRPAAAGVKSERDVDGFDDGDDGNDNGNVGRERGAVPFSADFRAVSPVDNNSNAIRENNIFDGIDRPDEVASEVRGGGEASGEAKSAKGPKDIFLSLRDEDYKRIITDGCGLLLLRKPLQIKDRWQGMFNELNYKWGYIFDNDELNPKGLAQKLFDALKVKMMGGKFYRRSLGCKSYQRAEPQEALDKITDDLTREQVNYFKHKKKVLQSAASKGNGRNDATPVSAAPPTKQPVDPTPDRNIVEKHKKKLLQSAASKGNGRNDATPVATAPPTKQPVDPAPDRNVVLSLHDKKYKKIIDDYVASLLVVDGDIEAKVSDCVKHVEAGGGYFYKVKPGRRLEEIDASEGRNRICKDIREGLAEARKYHKQILVVNKKNKRYKTIINSEVEGLVRENGGQKIDKGWARAVGEARLNQLEESGVKYFFWYAKDERQILRREALDKIVQDIAQSDLWNKKGGAKAVTVTVDGDTAISSTRMKRRTVGNGTSAAKEDPRGYIASYVIRNILRRNKKWRVRTVQNCGLDEITASRVNSDEEFTGPDEILDEAFLSGLYDEEVVDKEEGQGFLENAGIKDDPYSIFLPKVKEERKRRKLISEEQKSRNEGASVAAGGNGGVSINRSETSPNGNVGESAQVLTNRACSPSIFSGEVEWVRVRKRQKLSSDGRKSRSEGDSVAAAGNGGVSINRSETSPNGNVGESAQVLTNSARSPSIFSEEVERERKGQKLSTEEQKPRSEGESVAAEENGGVSTNCPETRPKCNVGKSAQVLTNSARSPSGTQNEPAATRPVSINIEGRKEARRIYTLISEKLANAKKLSGGHPTTTNEGRNATLQKEFYSCIKRWLAPKAKTVQESELNALNIQMGEFESCISDLQEAIGAGDEDDILFSMGICESSLDDCKNKYAM